MKTNCSKSPDWDSDGESWSESEGLSPSDSREHFVESLALHVIGLNRVKWWPVTGIGRLMEEWLSKEPWMGQRCRLVDRRRGCTAV